MNKINLKNVFSSKNVLFFLLPVCLWLFLFRGFVGGNFTLTNDAVPYYEHTKFYLDNIKQGVLPLWDPTRNEGIPNEFFLRRIGELNPFYFLVLVLDAIGFSYTTAYLLFCAFYYLLGVAGFYLLSKRLFSSEEGAYAAALLLMFSSLGTKVFESYLMLLLTPTIWFFYFLLSFIKRQEKFFFLGLVFSCMLLVVTYLPFYFLTTLLIFLFCFSLVYFQEYRGVFAKFVAFIKKNKVFSSLCVFALLLTLIPGGLFFHEIDRGEVVMPRRHYDGVAGAGDVVPSQNQISVSINRVTEGGLMAPIVYERASENLDSFSLGREYLPCFAFLLIAMGLAVAVNRKLICLWLIFFVALLISLTDATPVYPFLYEWIPYFKFFRNLSHFFWLIILPVFILFVGEVLRNLLAQPLELKKERYSYFVFVLFVHVGAFIFLLFEDNIICSTFIAVGLSCVFFMLQSLGFFDKKHSFIMRLLLFIIVVSQPVEVFFFLNENARVISKAYPYDQAVSGLNLKSQEELNRYEREWEWKRIKDADFKSPAPMYFGSKWFNILQSEMKIKDVTQRKYIDQPLVLYDNIKEVDENFVSLDDFEKNLMSEGNVAFVNTKNPMNMARKEVRVNGTTPQIVVRDSKDVKVEYSDVNSLRLRTRFNNWKFLVYNDCYNSAWQAFIDRKKTQVYRANFAFKGVWVPPGEHVVFFRYGEMWRYLLKFFLMALFNVVFVFLLFLGKKYYCLRESSYEG